MHLILQALLNAAEGTLLKMMTTCFKQGQTAYLVHLELNFHLNVNKSAHHKHPKAMAVCALLVSKVNTQRCIMWSKERRR